MIKIGLSEKRKKILHEELERIVPKIIASGVEKIILFGSLVNKEIHKSSDIDILIIKETNKSFLERLEECYTIFKPRCKIDFFVYTPQEFEKMMQDSLFIQKVVEKGVIIYEKKSYRRI